MTRLQLVALIENIPLNM